MLPQSNSASLGTRVPEWRQTIPDNWTKGVTKREYWDQIEIYSELAVSLAKNDFEKLIQLTSQMQNLPESARQPLISHLESDALLAVPEERRLGLWNELLDLVLKHRRFTGAVWAMKPDTIDRIAAVAERIAPVESFIRHRRLFSESEIDLYEENLSYEENQKQLEERRQDAVAEIANQGGVQSVIAFATSVETPWYVGFAYGKIVHHDTNVLPDLLSVGQTAVIQFVHGFARGRLSADGWDWVDSVDTSKCSSSQVGYFLSLLPFSTETWVRVKRLARRGVIEYWSKTRVNPFEGSKNLDVALRPLIQNKRPIAALQCIHRIVQNKQPIDSKIAIRALNAALTSPERADSMKSFYIAETIKALQNDPDTSQKELSIVEWAYLSLLNYNSGSPKTLWRRLATEPLFFCEMIGLAFRSETDVRATKGPNDKIKGLATNAYRLLSDWQTPPGLREDGTFDSDHLESWLKVVKAESQETGHFGVAMTMVGEALTYVPADPDGLWIHCAAARALDAKDADQMRNGYSCGLFNSRGAYWVDESGAEERNLAANYRVRADAAEQHGFHRLATALRDLAANYDREAEGGILPPDFEE
jgi:hypothetical protein